MNKKPFELGIIVGRFQTFHIGHGYIIEKAAAVCETLAVFIGSSQESGTLKNPFTYETRKRILKKLYGDKIVIFPLPDIGVGNNSTWGRYVLNSAEERFNKTPDLLISGREQRRIDWFDGIEDVCVSELYVPKIIDISATRMRDFFISGDFESWKKYTNKKLWDEYNLLRAEVIASKDNLFSESL